MKEIEFSTMNLIPAAGIGDSFFDAFTAHHQVKVRSLYIEWGDAWSQLVQFGLNSHGPDVSEVGTTWLGGLHAMESLRPITPGETTLFGGEQYFPPAIW